MPKVKIFDYTVHWARGSMTRKLGSCCLLRRSCSGMDLLLALMRSHRIMNVSSHALSMFLSAYGLNVCKNATKATKIRSLLTLESVKQFCKQEELDCLEAKLLASEERRNKKSSSNHADDDDEDEECKEDVT